MPDSGDRAEAEHHLLVHVQHRDQQQQRPQQLRAVDLAGLPVGGERAGVVIADHDDQAGADDREQRLELRRQRRPRGMVIEPDRAEGAADVTDVRLVKHRGTGGACHLNINCSHWSSPLSRFHSSGIEAHAHAAKDRRRLSGEISRFIGISRQHRRLTVTPCSGRAIERVKATVASACAWDKQEQRREGPTSARTIRVHRTPPFVRGARARQHNDTSQEEPSMTVAGTHPCQPGGHLSRKSFGTPRRSDAAQPLGLSP